MTIQFNHTIVAARDKKESARFLTDLLGLPAAVPAGPFLAVPLSNGVTLDYAEVPACDIFFQHLAFLVSEDEFDGIFARLEATGRTYWADPHGRLPGEINRNDGGRGVYFTDDNGHGLEVITVPYGGW